MIEQAFHAYTKAVEARRRPPTTKRGLVELRNKARHLCDLVDQLEDGPEFSALLEATRSEFRNDDWHSARDESWWRDPIRNFFRRTGYYTDTLFKGSDTSRDLFQRYEEAFQRRSVQTTYLAPMEFVKFPKPELKFSGFEIRRFDRKELDKFVGNDVNRVFHPHAVVDTAVLQEYWFIVVKAEEEAPRLRPPLLTISKEALGFVSPKYTRLPPAIEHVLERLVLFDWLEKPQEERPRKEQKPRKACWPYGLPFGFETPFVIPVDDNDLQQPKSAPDCSTLNSYGIKHVDPDTEEEYKGHFVVIDLNESRVVAFEQCIKRADECLGNLEKKHRDTDSSYLETHWPFLKVAIGNLIKAFFTDGPEQLLWHITVLDALLGEKHSTRKPIARRSAAILATTEGKKEEMREQFEDVYQLRCDLVHGNQFKKDIHRQQLFEARMMARRVTIWFVHYLGEVAARINEGTWKSEVPDREDFLILLDRRSSNADQKRLQAILGVLPNEFPTAPDWSS